MRTRINQLFVEIFLVIVVTAIVAFVCFNLAELIDMFSRAISNALTRSPLGF